MSSNGSNLGALIGRLCWVVFTSRLFKGQVTLYPIAMVITCFEPNGEGSVHVQYPSRLEVPDIEDYSSFSVKNFKSYRAQNFFSPEFSRISVEPIRARRFSKRAYDNRLIIQNILNVLNRIGSVRKKI